MSFTPSPLLYLISLQLYKGFILSSCRNYLDDCQITVVMVTCGGIVGVLCIHTYTSRDSCCVLDVKIIAMKWKLLNFEMCHHCWIGHIHCKMLAFNNYRLWIEGFLFSKYFRFTYAGKCLNYRKSFSFVVIGFGRRAISRILRLTFELE